MQIVPVQHSIHDSRCWPDQILEWTFVFERRLSVIYEIWIMTCLPIIWNWVQIVFRRHILISKVNIGGIGDVFDLRIHSLTSSIVCLVHFRLRRVCSRRPVELWSIYFIYCISYTKFNTTSVQTDNFNVFLSGVLIVLILSTTDSLLVSFESKSNKYNVDYLDKQTVI